MKRSIKVFGTLLVCCLWSLLLLAATTDEIKQAISKGAKGMITFRVVDSKSNPVAGAQVGAGFYNQNMKGDGAGVSGKTDSYGPIFPRFGLQVEVTDIEYSRINKGYNLC